MNAIELLKSDHRRVKNLFDQVEQSDSWSDKKRAFKIIKHELELHMMVEEQVLYPMFQARAEFKDQVDEAFEEHQEAKSLLLDIEKNGENENEFENLFEELVEAVEHHVHEEEEELFLKIQKTLSSEELVEIGLKLEDAKKAIDSRRHAA